MTSAPGNVTQDSQHGDPYVTPDPQNGTFSIHPSTQQFGPRPDWILYTVPAFACLVGLYLFSLVLIKHRKTEERKRREEIRSKAKSIQLRLNGFNSESEDKDDDPCKAEAMAAQSYENVEAAVYFNREAVTYYVPAEEGDDYVTPDTEGCETEEGSGETQNDSLFPPQNLTDTDGESYENMESALYAKPRRRPAQDADTQEEEDYIDPDGGEKEKDGESYENMESSEYSQPRRHSNPDLPHCQRTAQEGTEEEEDDSYEKMASIAVPGTTERETDWEGGRAKARRDWYHTQKTV